VKVEYSKTSYDWFNHSTIKLLFKPLYFAYVLNIGKEPLLLLRCIYNTFLLINKYRYKQTRWQNKVRFRFGFDGRGVGRARKCYRPKACGHHHHCWTVAHSVLASNLSVVRL